MSGGIQTNWLTWRKPWRRPNNSESEYRKQKRRPQGLFFILEDREIFTFCAQSQEVRSLIKLCKLPVK